DCIGNGRNRTERERAHDCVHGRVRQRNTFTWQVYEFHLEAGSFALFVSSAHHASIRLKRVYLLHLCRIVVRKVHSRSHADFQYIALCERQYALPNLRYWSRIPKRAYEMGIDVLSVEKHCASPELRAG